MRINMKKAGLSLAALLCASSSSVAIAGDTVIVLTDYPSAAEGLRDRLVAAGYDVVTTQNAADLSGSLTSYKQVWDVRISTGLTADQTSSYMNYLNSAGGLFLLGENSGFATRNNSIVNFIVGAGGGDVTYGGGLVTSEYVTDVFNGAAIVVPDSATSFYVPAAGTFATPGNGIFITTTGPGGTGQGTGIAFGAGTLSNAPTGRLLTYLDVNTFESSYYNATPALRALVDRMIGFVAGDFQVVPGPAIIDGSQPSFNLSDPAATGTTITFDGGTLDMTGNADPSNLVSADVAINDGGAFINTAGTSSTLSGTVSGNGGLIVSGQGTLALTGTNSYASGTVISDSSTVQIDGGEALGTGGVVLMGGRLQTTASMQLNAPVTLMSGVNSIDTGGNDVLLDGTISGTGGFVKNGNGTLTMTGANTYTGGTFVQAGTLAGDTHSLVGDIASNGTVEFAQSSDGTYVGMLSGTGRLVKSGSGALTLTGVNNHSGGTTVEAGTLVVNTGTIGGNIANAGTVEFAQSGNGTYVGTLSGTGSLVKSGNGMLTLTGANSHTGGTTVEAGTLMVNTGTIGGNIANAGTVEFAQTGNGTYVGTLSGTGSLVKSGNGMLTLTGANSHTGGTTVEAGTLVVNTGTIGGNIANAGTVEFAQTGNGTYAGTLSGTGSLVKSGSGTLVLTGANNHSGGTTVEAGALVVNTGTIGGNIANTGTVEFAQTGNGTYAGTLSGTGGLVKSGNGTLTLIGANTYTGGTTIQAGALVASTASISGDVANAGTLVIDQTADGRFDGAISGTGTFLKKGTGKVNLTGTSSFAGNTVIDGGRLAVNGSIASSNVAVQSGGSIGGNGTVGGLIVRTDATAAPGNSIGQLHAATTVLFEPGSFYQVEADASGASDRIAATGTATLQGGTVQVLAAAGDYRPQTSYEILTAAQVDGTFADVTSNLAFLMPTLSYTGTSVKLTLTRNDVAFADVAATRNQRATATAIDASFAPTSDLYYAIVGQSAETARAAFDRLSGEAHASALSVAAQDAEGMRRSLLDRLAAPQPGPTEIWTEVLGSWTDLDGNGNAADVSSNMRGFRAGLEKGMGSARIGIAGGYSTGDLNIPGRASTGEVNAVNAAVYGGAMIGGFGIRAGASYSWLDFDINRTATAGALSQQLKADYDGRAIQSFGEIGYILAAGAGRFEPFAGVDALWLKNNAFAERGGDLALYSAASTRDYAWSTVGLKSSFTLGADSPLSASFKAGWQHALSGQAVASTMAFADGPAFSVEGAPLAKDAGLLDARLDWAVSKSVRLGVGYTGTLADQSQTHAAKAVLTVGF